jgi:RNase H-fold protein (predicted Holliday junction resolvase)
MYAALDISKNRIGVAFSSSDCQSVIWADTIRNKPKLLASLYLKYKPEMTIIGLPTHPDGIPTSNGYFIKEFVEQNPFIGAFKFVDEYLSTREAEEAIQRMKLKIEKDTLVAKIMIYKHFQIESALLYYGLYY